jgi:O-antigen ligase
MATAALCTTVVGLVCTFSRGSWVSVLAGTGVLLFLGERRFVLRVIGAAFVAALVVDIGTGGAVQQRITGTFTDWAVTQRAALMLAGIQLFLEHPILGAGPGAFAVELDRLGALVPTLWDLQSTPHNAYIQVAAESGLVGLTIWIGLLAGLIRRGVRAVSHSTDVGAQTGLRRAALWTLAIFCVLGMFVWPLSHGHAQLAVIAAAIVCSAPLRHPSRAPAHGNGKPAAIARARITGGAA